MRKILLKTRHPELSVDNDRYDEQIKNPKKLESGFRNAADDIGEHGRDGNNIKQHECEVGRSGKPIDTEKSKDDMVAEKRLLYDDVVRYAKYTRLRRVRNNNIVSCWRVFCTSFAGTCSVGGGCGGFFFLPPVRRPVGGGGVGA